MLTAKYEDAVAASQKLLDDLRDFQEWYTRECAAFASSAQKDDGENQKDDERRK
jgi:hypothetical protein